MSEFKDVKNLDELLKTTHDIDPVMEDPINKHIDYLIELATGLKNFIHDERTFYVMLADIQTRAGKLIDEYKKNPKRH
jgi:hypothetical protein